MTKEDSKEKIRGVVVIALTCFDENLAFDEQAYRRHLRRITVEAGITGEDGAIIVNGSTGECAAMSQAERKKVAETAVNEIGDILPVIIGCNHSDVNQTIELVQHAEEIKAAGAMILPPYYFTPPKDDEILAFYQRISKESSIGILYYNNVGISKYDLPPELLSKLADTTNVVAIKECTPYLPKMEQTVRKVGHKVHVLNGQGEFMEPYAALIGTAGFITSTANFAPRLALDMWKARSKMDFEQGGKIRLKLAPYLDYIAKEGVKGEPRALSLIKKFTQLVGSPVGPGRLPLLPVSKEDAENIRVVLSEMELI